MSTDAAALPAASKKKGGKKLILIILAAVVLLGGGIVGGLYAAGFGLFGHKDAKEAEDPNKPTLVLREGVKEGTKPKKDKTGAPIIDPSKYQVSYYTLEQTFTSNVRDSDGFVQLGIGVSTFYDQRVLDAVKRNEIPVRSAVLMALADQDAFVISTPEGKKQLQKQLKDAINQILVQKEGFGGIDDVYFTTFIIQ
jgi:flagellar FliL protein